MVQFTVRADGKYIAKLCGIAAGLPRFNASRSYPSVPKNRAVFSSLLLESHMFNPILQSGNNHSSTHSPEGKKKKIRRRKVEQYIYCGTYKRVVGTTTPKIHFRRPTWPMRQSLNVYEACTRISTGVHKGTPTREPNWNVFRCKTGSPKQNSPISSETHFRIHQPGSTKFNERQRRLELSFGA